MIESTEPLSQSGGVAPSAFLPAPAYWRSPSCGAGSFRDILRRSGILVPVGRVGADLLYPFSCLSRPLRGARALYILLLSIVRAEGGSGLTDVAYVSRVKVEPVEGKVRRAQLPGKEDPVLFGVHSEVAEHYGVSPDEEEPHPSTLDYLVAAAGG